MIRKKAFSIISKKTFLESNVALSMQYNHSLPLATKALYNSSNAAGQNNTEESIACMTLSYNYSILLITKSIGKKKRP